MSSRNVDVQLTVYRTLDGKPAKEDDENSLTYHLSISGRYDPGRPPPPCSNPDSPRFSDPGDPPEFDYDKIEIDEVVDWEGEVVDKDHPLFSKILKPEKIELTSSEDDALYDAMPYDAYDDGPDPDEEYERYLDREAEKAGY